MDPEFVVKYGVVGLLCIAVTVLAGVCRFLYNELKAERARTDQFIGKIEAQRDDYRQIAIDVIRSQDRANTIIEQHTRALDKSRSGDAWRAQRG